MSNKHSITLYLTEKRAYDAAELENDYRVNTGLEPAGIRIVSATMRDHDGTVDRGWKAQMTFHYARDNYFL